MTSDDSVPNHPIAITGMHRSGTSMITRGLHESGLHLIGGDADALLAAADDNPEGFWENKAIVTCNDDLLEAAGGSWDNPPSLLPVAVDDPRLAAVVEPATAALVGLAENDRWGFKDPRTCLTAAFWLDLQPDLRFIICVRNPLEVALSLKRRNQNSYSLGLSLWERYYESILDLVPEDRRIVTHYDTYFLDPGGELARLCDFAGLDAAELEVRSDLRHHDVGVSLDEANLGASLRGLYTRLCEEAGAPAPRPAVVDEGQVRRLVLDGTVSARHAEQRQKAIERLEERLTESQAAEREARDQLNQVRRESEARRAELAAVQRELDNVRADLTDRFDALDERSAVIQEQNLRLIDSTDTLGESVERLEDRQRATLDRTNHVSDILDAVHVKLRAVENSVGRGSSPSLRSRVKRMLGGVVRRLRGRSAPAAKRTLESTARRMPEPVRHSIRRVRRAAADGQAGNRVRERAGRVVGRLPSPAQTVVRRGERAVRRSGAVPKAKRAARGVARRLPDPAKRIVKSAVAGSASSPGRSAPSRPKKAVPAPRPTRRADGRAADVPKGPPAFKWQKGYERLVGEFIAADTAWAVVTPGCKPGVGAVGANPATPFPSFDGTAPAADSVALVAVLEALRLSGTQRLVLPEGARPWYQSHPELRDHLGRSHRVLADRDAAGVVFDLTAPADERRGALAAIKDLSAGRVSRPAVLDWTDLDIAGDLPGFTTFGPALAKAFDVLPYFDDSVEIVVTTQHHDLEEARRVASTAVVICTRRGTDLLVERVEPVCDLAAPGPSVAVITASSTDAVDAAVGERVAEIGGELVLTADPTSVVADVVMVLEPGVVPLPGALAAACTTTLEAPSAVSVAKVLDHHGRVESVGGMVFSDGSVAGIAAGTLAVRAPWHEYSRPVCWGGGIVSATSGLWADLPTFTGDDLVGWCGSVWAHGRVVEYRPTATGLRVEGRPAHSSTAGGAWTARLGSRPHRPGELGDGAWRYLLANDHIAAEATGGA